MTRASLQRACFGRRTGFVVNGAKLPGDGAVFGFGAETAIFTGAAAYVHCEDEFAGGSSSHAFTAGVRYGR